MGSSAVSNMTASDFMSTDILAVSPDDNAFDLGSSMERFHVGKAVVVSDLEFLGIVSKETFVAYMHKYPDTNIKELKVEDFMEADVCTAKPDESFESVVELLMCQKSMIDCVPVLSSGKFKGLISSVDMTKYYLKNMDGKYKVSKLMHYNPLTVDDYTPLSEVIQAMRNMSEKRVLVMSGNTLVGIVTIKDMGLTIFKESAKKQGVSVKSELTAGDVMTKEPIVARPKDDAAVAAGVMLKKKIGGLPVVSEKLEGLIDRMDLIKGIKLSF
ncbi:MAG: CBS domain-containing protein [Candidatus Altiarchaeota archaeon]|nr:CBS domain-containing protein [Candidatus Altiarchaeota archaeon]